MIFSSQSNQWFAQKTLLAVILLASPAGFSQSNDFSPKPLPDATDPICGFISGPHLFGVANEVKRGLAVDLLVGETHLNQPLILRFFINQKPANTPEDNLLVEHEKFLHVIGVRDDLREFFHIHPLKVAPGLWEVTHTFTNGGNYKIWTDIKRAGVAYTFVQPTLVISGKLDSRSTPPADNDTDQVGAWRLQFSHPDKILSGATNQFSFLVTGKEGQPAVRKDAPGLDQRRSARLFACPS